MEDKYLNGRGLIEYTDKVKEKMAFIEDPSTAGVPPSLVDLVYPVGTYYKTSNTSFNPNTVFGGTWTEDTTAQVVAYARVSGSTLLKSKNIASVSWSNNIATVTFSKAMADANYVVNVSGETGGQGAEIIGVYGADTGKFNIDNTKHDGSPVALNDMHIMVHGHLATPEYKIWKRTA